VLYPAIQGKYPDTYAFEKIAPRREKKVLAFRKSVFLNVRIASLVLIWRG
jgi:hypothetical protein